MVDWRKILIFKHWFQLKWHLLSKRQECQKKKKKNDNFNKRQKYIQARMNKILLPVRQANFGKKKMKKRYRFFFWLLLCVNVYLLLRCHNCDQTCLVGLKSQKKKWDGPNLVVGLLVNTGRPMVCMALGLPVPSVPEHTPSSSPAW